MGTLELIATVQRAGASFVVDGDRVVIRGPKGAVTAEIFEELRSHKAEILDCLQFPTADSYIRLLRTNDVLNATDLPPIPPSWITETGQHRAETWAAWWAAVDAQRRRARKQNHA